jgi:hypothetical protein
VTVLPAAPLPNLGKALAFPAEAGTVHVMATTERVLVTLQDRKRANLAKIAEFDQYLVHAEPDGTLIWEPADVVTVTERKLAADEDLMARLAANREDPSRLKPRDRSSAPRA